MEPGGRTTTKPNATIDGGARVRLSKAETEVQTSMNLWFNVPVAPVAYEVMLKPDVGLFREFEPRRVHTRTNSLGLFLVHKLTCGKRESVS